MRGPKGTYPFVGKVPESFGQRWVHREASMSKRTHRDRGTDPKPFPPLVSAADVGRAGRTKVEYDDHIGTMLEEHARRRAPTRQTTHRHLIGVSGELGVAAWRRKPMDRRIMPDYEGDDGYDLTVSLRNDRRGPVEVKTTRDMQSPERTVTNDELSSADVFVLCCTDAPRRRVEVVGWTTERMVRPFGDVYGRGQDEYLLSPQYSYPPIPTQIKPDRVRETQYRR